MNKPGGMTSRQAVDRVQRLVRPAKAGHSGTLDPLASGVLVVCVGAATRLIQYILRMPKSYTAAFILGCSSATEDIEAELIELDHPPVPSLAQIADAAKGLVGTIQQRPPAYSALKVRGHRAYKLARRGEPPALEPRNVTVYRLEITSYHYPELTLEIQCSSGTYVRSLGRDLAESVGTAAVMSNLVRTSVGGFCLGDAVPLEQLTPANLPDCLLPPLRAVELLRRVELSAEELALIRQGRPIAKESPSPQCLELAGVDAAGRLAAVLTHRGPGLLGPICNLPQEE